MTRRIRVLGGLILGWVVAPVAFLVVGLALVWNDPVTPNAPVLEGLLSGWSVPEIAALVGMSVALFAAMTYTGTMYLRSHRGRP